MMISGNDVHARLRKLRDQTERQLEDFIEIVEDAEEEAAPKKRQKEVMRAVLPRG